MNSTIKTSRRKISICLFVEDWHNSVLSWMINDWCSFFNKNCYLTIPFYEAKVLHNIKYVDLLKLRGALTSDPDDDLFLADLCIGYDSINFCNYNILKKIKNKNINTVLCIKEKSLSDIERSAIASSLVDRVWVLDYLYNDSIIDEILKINFNQQISVIEDCYNNVSFSANKEIAFISRNDEVTFTKTLGLIDYLKSVSQYPIFDYYYSDLLKNNQIINAYDCYVFYATEAADREELRLIDYVSKYKNSIVNDFNKYVRKMYKVYNSKEDIVKFIVNNDKDIRKIKSDGAISFKKAIFDMI